MPQVGAMGGEGPAVCTAGQGCGAETAAMDTSLSLCL